MGFQIAIDGPAGAGKSTIAKLVAQKLGYTYIDTGAMYRAMGLFFDENGPWPETEEGIKELSGKADITIKYIGKELTVFLNGNNVNGIIRGEKAGASASKVSTYPAVREKLVELQQKMAGEMDVVMDGRDIGTIVLPDADLKIYMVADVKERAKRRYIDMLEKGQHESIEEIIRDLEARDYQDMHRAASPLRQADDAILLDTTKMTIYDVVDNIIALIDERKKA